MPLSIWYAHRLEIYFHEYVQQHILLGFALYLYFVLMACNISMVLFNYARWIFPYAELEGYSVGNRRTHRCVLGALVLGITSGLIYDLVKLLV